MWANRAHVDEVLPEAKNLKPYLSTAESTKCAENAAAGAKGFRASTPSFDFVTSLNTATIEKPKGFSMVKVICEAYY